MTRLLKSLYPSQQYFLLVKLFNLLMVFKIGIFFINFYSIEIWFFDCIFSSIIMFLYGVTMFKLTIKIKKFSSLETTKVYNFLRWFPYDFFLIMSDRKPYNSLAFILGIETLTILFFIIKYHKFVFDVFFFVLGFCSYRIISQLTNFTLIDFPRQFFTIYLWNYFYQFLITLNRRKNTMSINWLY